MGIVNKTAQQIVDSKEPMGKRCIKPAPPIVQLQRRPDEHMKWHLRHKPYGRGDDTNADRTTEREKTAIRERRQERVSVSVPESFTERESN